MQTKRRLTDILRTNSDRQQLADSWDRTAPAGDFEPLPAGYYVAHVHCLELFTARTGTPGVKIQFRVAEGEHVGRMIFHDAWLTPAALPQTKRDCAKLGLLTLDQLETACIPPGRIRCKVRVALRTDDDGERFNRVRQFDVLSIDEPEADAFAPTEPDDADLRGADSSAPSLPTEPDAPHADDFPFGANVAGGPS